MKNAVNSTSADPLASFAGVVTLRKLEAFAQVYGDRSLEQAGYRLNLPKRILGGMIRDLETAFGSDLFDRKEDGSLVPTAFGERFHHDMRFLTEASRRLEDRIEATRRSGRVFRIGSSPIVFKTPFFSRLFRELRTATDMRISYVPVAGRDAARALTAGRCDWYVGCRENIGSRFASERIAEVGLRSYRRTGVSPEPRAAIRYVVVIDGKAPQPAGRRGSWRPIPEELWLRWLDRPEECGAGSVIFAPETPVDPESWKQGGTGPEGACQPVNCSYLRQHPYEFIPTLLHRVRSRFLPG